jgi:hypothetical protein
LATGIAVSGSDVYVTGYSYDLTYSSNDMPSPVFWKNGVLDSLFITGNQAQTVAVAVQGSDVYIAGSSLGLGSNTMAECWKNGVLDSLGEGVPNAIAVSGTDVYVVGEAHNSNTEFVAVCWKNGKHRWGLR